MADNKRKKKADGKRINVKQSHELAYWTRKLNVSSIALALACGYYRSPTVASVRRRLAHARKTLREEK